VTIPAGTQPDTVLRLRGKGFPAFGGGRRGDLYVVVRMWVPYHLAAKEHKLYERLRVLASKALGRGLMDRTRRSDYGNRRNGSTGTCLGTAVPARMRASLAGGMSLLG
jgi:DnaJ-class molecular chaperone